MSKPAPSHTQLKSIVTAMSVVTLLSACATTSEPKFKTKEAHTFELTSLNNSKQTKGNVTIEDVGEAKKVLAPIKIHACNGTELKYETKNYTQNGVPMQKQVKVMQTVNPLEGMYIRRLKITNSGQHTLRMNQIDSVLVDGAGTDHETMSKERLKQKIRARIPCSSNYAVLNAIDTLKIIGSNARIRSGRTTELHAIFSGVNKAISGDWALELNDVPVKTNEANQPLKVTSFKFPLMVKHLKTIINYRKDSFFSPWREINRDTQQIK